MKQEHHHLEQKEIYIYSVFLLNFGADYELFYDSYLHFERPLCIRICFGVHVSVSFSFFFTHSIPPLSLSTLSFFNSPAYFGSSELRLVRKKFFLEDPFNLPKKPLAPHICHISHIRSPFPSSCLDRPHIPALRDRLLPHTLFAPMYFFNVFLYCISQLYF